MAVEALSLCQLRDAEPDTVRDAEPDTVRDAEPGTESILSDLQA